MATAVPEESRKRMMMMMRRRIRDEAMAGQPAGAEGAAAAASITR